MNIDLSPHHAIDSFLEIVDQITFSSVQRGFESIVFHPATQVTLYSVMCVYLMTFLMKVKYYGTPFSEITPMLGKMVFIFIVATNWMVFQTLIYNVFTVYPLELSAHLTNILSSSIGAGGHDSSLGEVFYEGMRQVGLIFKSISVYPSSWIPCLFSGVLMFIGTCLFTGYAVYLLVMSKFFLTINLILAPYFLVMFLFNGTRGLSEGWIKECIYYGFTPVIVGLVLVFTMSIATAILFDGSSLAPAAPSFTRAILFGFFSLICFAMLVAIPHKFATTTASSSIPGVKSVSSQGKAISNYAKNTKKNIGEVREKNQERRAQHRENMQRKINERKAREDALAAKRRNGGLF